MGEKNTTDIEDDTLAQFPANFADSDLTQDQPATDTQIGEDTFKKTHISSVKARTHSQQRSNQKTSQNPKVKKATLYSRYTPIAAGLLAVLAIIAAGTLGQLYKNKVMPGVYVAGQNIGGKTEAQVRQLLESRQKNYQVTLQLNETMLTPKPAEIGQSFQIEPTIKAVLSAKRDQGIVERVSFWKKQEIPVAVTVNNNLLAQYVETNFPELVTPPTDATLSFDSKALSFSVSKQAMGKGADLLKLKADVATSGALLKPVTLVVKPAPKGPSIAERDLKPLVADANEYIKRKIVLTGLGYSFVARPTDIANWITPTPQKNSTVKLVVDPAKVQSFVESISKRISSSPQDKKIVVDAATGQEVIIQEGRDGTELADKVSLANEIANSVTEGKDAARTMNIQVAAYKTVNMNAFEKWIEVDLSEQRTTAYERATPVKSFVIASGTRGYETVKGEFEIWLRVRSQTMQGGSRADGDYYSIPNVEWVSYFYKDYALHGAWWREKFGAPASHGCVNMRNEDAKWIYEWAPLRTKVIVHD